MNDIREASGRVATPDGASTPAHDQDDHLNALPRGTMLFEYKITAVLGQGGFGVTYLAEDTLLAEPVAIKEFFPSHAAVRANDQSVRARTKRETDSFREGVQSFLTEARLIARFRHPNIMQVRRFFEAHGTGYMVLDFIHGRSLEEAMHAGPLPEPVIRSILSGILDGLSTVHDRAILHRDLKPRNVILRNDDQPVLIDFGSARDFGARDSETVTQIVSPGYSSPEQYGIGDQGPWSDFYSLGAILYRAVTGTPPVDSLRRLGTDPLTPASVAAKGRYDPALLELVDRLLSIEPAARPASTAAVAEIVPLPGAGPLTEVAVIADKTAGLVRQWWHRDNIQGGLARLREALEGKPEVLVGAAGAVAVLAVLLGVWLVHARAPRETQPKAQVTTEIKTKPDSALTPGTQFKDCADCPSMKVLAPGTFAMGSNDGPMDQRPVHQVNIANPFAIGVKEVTAGEWKACVSAGGCEAPSGFEDARPNAPVLNITWLDAESYAAWLSKKTGARYRVPTEAQWEYAARGGTTTRFWWGDTLGTGHASCADCGPSDAKQTARDVGSLAPNPFGLYDTAGNAAEWVRDCWSPDYQDTPTDGRAATSAECAQHVLRGGSFNSPSRYLSSASRFRYDTAVPYYTNGLRVVREISRS